MLLDVFLLKKRQNQINTCVGLSQWVCLIPLIEHEQHHLCHGLNTLEFPDMTSYSLSLSNKKKKGLGAAWDERIMKTAYTGVPSTTNGAVRRWRLEDSFLFYIVFPSEAEQPGCVQQERSGVSATGVHDLRGEGREATASCFLKLPPQVKYWAPLDWSHVCVLRRV